MQSFIVRSINSAAPSSSPRATPGLPARWLRLWWWGLRGVWLAGGFGESGGKSLGLILAEVIFPETKRKKIGDYILDDELFGV
jgi:hypothetical protein